MNEKLSRFLFFLEFIVFALPALYILATYAVMFGAWCFYALIVVLGLLTMEFNSPEFLKAFGAVGAFSVLVLIAGSGLVALWKFLTVSFAFMCGGRVKLLAYRSKFRSGVMWAILPLCLMIPIAAVAVGDLAGLNIIVIGYVTGLTILVPAAHLWAETRERPAE